MSMTALPTGRPALIDQIDLADNVATLRTIAQRQVDALSGDQRALLKTGMREAQKAHKTAKEYTTTGHLSYRITPDERIARDTQLSSAFKAVLEYNYARRNYSPGSGGIRVESAGLGFQTHLVS